jgi:hypothetical protein
MQINAAVYSRQHLTHSVFPLLHLQYTWIHDLYTFN